MMLRAEPRSALRRNTEFLLPYVRAAIDRGEIRKDIDPVAASEWLARIIYSLTTAQKALTFDMAKPKSVRKFVEAFAVSGLQ